MTQEIMEALEKKISTLIDNYTALKEENERVNAENQAFRDEREGLKSRLDVILSKIDEI